MCVETTPVIAYIDTTRYTKSHLHERPQELEAAEDRLAGRELLGREAPERVGPQPAGADAGRPVQG